MSKTFDAPRLIDCGPVDSHAPTLFDQPILAEYAGGKGLDEMIRQAGRDHAEADRLRDAIGVPEEQEKLT